MAADWLKQAAHPSRGNGVSVRRVTGEDSADRLADGVATILRLGRVGHDLLVATAPDEFTVLAVEQVDLEGRHLVAGGLRRSGRPAQSGPPWCPPLQGAGRVGRAVRRQPGGYVVR